MSRQNQPTERMIRTVSELHYSKTPTQQNCILRKYRTENRQVYRGVTGDFTSPLSTSHRIFHGEEIITKSLNPHVYRAAVSPRIVSNK